MIVLASCSASRNVYKHEDAKTVTTSKVDSTYREQLLSSLNEYVKTHAVIRIRKEEKYSQPQPEKNPPVQAESNAPSMEAPVLSDITEIDIDFSQDTNTDSEKEVSNECSSNKESLSKSDRTYSKESDNDVGWSTSLIIKTALLLSLLMFVYYKNKK